MDGLDVTALIERWIFSIHIGYLWLLFCYPQMWEDEEMSSRRGLIHPSCLKAEENGSEIFRLHYNCRRRMGHPVRPHAQSYMCGALTLTKSPSSDLDDLQHRWMNCFICLCLGLWGQWFYSPDNTQCPLSGGPLMLIWPQPPVTCCPPWSGDFEEGRGPC